MYSVSSAILPLCVRSTAQYVLLSYELFRTFGATHGAGPGVAVATGE
jgi:hypothetical protein